MVPLPFALLFHFTFIQAFCVSRLEIILQHLLKSWFGGAEFFQLLLVCKAFYFSFIFEWDPWLGTVIWAIVYFLTSVKVCPAIPSWPEEFLLKDQLLSLWESPCVLFVVFLLLLLIFVLCVWSLLTWLICVVGYLVLDLSCLKISGFLGLMWLFPSPFLGSFQLLSPQVFSHGLSFCLLLLGLLWFKCWGVYHCPRSLWGCPHFV